MSLVEREFKAVLDELLKTGLSLRKLSEEMGLSSTALGVARFDGVIYGDVHKLSVALRAKARVLQKFSPDKSSLDSVCKLGLIKQTYLAKQIGVSKQALNQAREVIPEARKAQITKAVRDIGFNVASLASRLEKVRT